MLYNKSYKSNLLISNFRNDLVCFFDHSLPKFFYYRYIFCCCCRRCCGSVFCQSVKILLLKNDKTFFLISF